MATEVSICNVALLRVGVRAPISSLDQRGQNAEVCNAIFSDMRDVVLEACHWGFAERRAVLAELFGVSRTGWEYVYAVPDDFIAARFIDAGVRNPRLAEQIPYKVVANDTKDGKVIATDLSPAELCYTARIETATAWPPGFCDALAWKLAEELAMGLPVKAEYADRAFKRYELAVARAGATDLNQEFEEEAEPDLLAARR